MKLLGFIKLVPVCTYLPLQIRLESPILYEQRMAGRQFWRQPRELYASDWASDCHLLARPHRALTFLGPYILVSNCNKKTVSDTNCLRPKQEWNSKETLNKYWSLQMEVISGNQKPVLLRVFCASSAPDNIVIFICLALRGHYANTSNKEIWNKRKRRKKIKHIYQKRSHLTLVSSLNSSAHFFLDWAVVEPSKR